ncbi:MAG: hypothetical protein ABH843_03050 [Candidatus Omnitrophota bacterium]
MGFDLYRMSGTRKTAVTIIGVSYILVMLIIIGKFHGINTIIGATLFFLAATFITFLWVK